MGIDVVLRLLLICFVFFFLLSCYSKGEYKDISDSLEYAELVGGRFEVLVPLVMHGVTFERDYGEVVDEFIVTIEPGFGGPEVLMRKILPVGSIVSIEKVLQCFTCVPTYVEFEVNLLSEDIDSSIPVRLSDVSIRNSKGCVMLNPRMFRRIK